MMVSEEEALEAYIDTPERVDFYKSGFEKYTVTGISQFQWHWSWWAFFGGVFYLLYRKLYLEALGYFLLFAVASFSPLISIVLWIVSGGVLPYFVYQRYLKTKAQVTQNLSSAQEQTEALRVVGGVNKWAIWVAVGLHLLMWVSALSFILMANARQMP